MAAYADLVSLENIIHNLEHHSRPPITLHKEQAHLLTQKVNFLQQFLKVYNPTLPYSKEADPLEARIAGAAYAAEDAIESHIFDQLSSYRDGEWLSTYGLYEDSEEVSSDGALYEALEKVIQDMALIKKEAMKINKKTGRFQNHHLHTKSTTPADSSSISSSSSSIVEKTSSMVGADDLLLEMKEKLVADARDLQTIPVVGMGGSGKTTLALSIYQDALIKERFDICAWATISQEYSVLKVLIQLLTQLIGKPNEELSGGELEEMLHKHLYGRKYMIILDDVWSLEAWDGVKRPFPNNRNGSRIVVTTRLTTLASTLSKYNSVGMKLLDDDDSWDLLSKSVFGGKGCPSRFEEIGRKIGKSCKGLPLSIVVIGGLLAKSEKSLEFWKHMEENLNEIVNLEDDERCLKTLYMSYKQLPVHLKPCFLYMGIYHEDYVICISKLVKLWVAEGFLKPTSGKRPEDVARAYIKDLSDRNLIMIHKLGSIGSIKECKVHDLLRDLCLREARKEGFYTVDPGHKIGYKMCRIVRPSTILEIDEEVDALSSAVPLARSLIFGEDLWKGPPPKIFRMLRIVNSDIGLGRDLDGKLVNLRSLTLGFRSKGFDIACLSWNLHTLVVSYYDPNGHIAPTDTWYMSCIRHLHITHLYFLDPPNNGIVLENLQSLGNVYDFICSEQIVKTIPNIRKLRLVYTYKMGGVDDEKLCLTNLECLHKLDSFSSQFSHSMYQTNYPQSLKKLCLTAPYWEAYVLDKIGALPLLQKLTLRGGIFKQVQWETSEGQFRSLKFLYFYKCKGLHLWTSVASHFPRLEKLHLCGFFDLEEIPSDFAEILTLTLID